MLYWFCYPPLLLTFLSNLRRNNYGLLPASTSCTANLAGLPVGCRLEPGSGAARRQCRDQNGRNGPARATSSQRTCHTDPQPAGAGVARRSCACPGSSARARGQSPPHHGRRACTAGAACWAKRPLVGGSSRGIPGARWLHHAIVEFCGPRLHRRRAARRCGRCGADTLYSDGQQLRQFTCGHLRESHWCIGNASLLIEQPGAERVTLPHRGGRSYRALR